MIRFLMIFSAVTLLTGCSVAREEWDGAVLTECAGLLGCVSRDGIAIGPSRLLRVEMSSGCHSLIIGTRSHLLESIEATCDGERPHE